MLYVHGSLLTRLFKAHRLVAEDALVHKLGTALGDDGCEIHQVKDLGLQVDAGSDLYKVDAVLLKFEDSTLCDVHNGLAGLVGVLAGESNLLDCIDELLLAAFLINDQFAVFAVLFQAAGREGADEEDLLGVLSDVDEAAAACKTGTELGDVDVAVLVALSQAEESRTPPMGPASTVRVM